MAFTRRKDNPEVPELLDPILKYSHISHGKPVINISCL